MMRERNQQESNPKLSTPTSKAPFLKPTDACDNETGGRAIAAYELVPETAPDFAHREEVLAEGAIDGRPGRRRSEVEKGEEEGGSLVDKGYTEVPH
jgi:hypothetical protein